MGDFTTICELRGRAASGRGCTNKNRYPNGVRHCALRNERGRCSSGSTDVDTLTFDGGSSGTAPGPITQLRDGMILSNGMMLGA